MRRLTRIEELQSIWQIWIKWENVTLNLILYPYPSYVCDLLGIWSLWETEAVDHLRIYISRPCRAARTALPPNANFGFVLLELLI